MKIELKYLWFGPDGNRRRGPDGKEKGIHTVPDEWAEKIPKTAKVLVPPKGKAEPVKPAEVDGVDIDMRGFRPELLEPTEPPKQTTLTVNKPAVAGRK